MLTLGMRRNRNSPLLRSVWQLAAPCLLIVLIVAFGVAQKRSVRSVNRVNQQFAQGTIVRRNDIANDRRYVRYLIRDRGKRYWLGSIAHRFEVAGGWRRIAETTLKHSGKQTTDKDVSESQFQVEAGQTVLIPL